MLNYNCFRSFFYLKLLRAVLAFSLTASSTCSWAAQSFSVETLPVPGTMVSSGVPLVPPVLKGMQVDPQKPFQFSFLLDTGHISRQLEDVREESARLIRYFLAALTVPAAELWVNLSPYDKDRIIPENFSRTEMGRDLLVQDYLLKQLAASMLHPDSVSGKRFWAEVYRRTYEMYGTTDIPSDVLNRVWVAPASARIHEDKGRVIIVEARLKVLLDREYRQGHLQSLATGAPETTNRDIQMDDVLREVIVPLLEQEVNEADHFAPLRQIYYSLVLARWYKESLGGNPLNAGYAGRNKVKGIDLAGQNDTRELYGRYMEALDRGAFSLIREEKTEHAQESVPRRYFSGGVDFAGGFPIDRAQTAAEVVVSGALLAVNGIFDLSMASFTGEQELSSRFEPGREETVDFAELTDAQKEEHYSRMARKIIWIEKIYSGIARYRLRNSITVHDVKVLIEQLLRSDPLAGIMSIPGGQRVVVFQRPGSAPGKLGLKDLNAILGESLNNLVIADTRVALTEALQAEGLVPRIAWSDYKTTIYVFDNDKDFSDIQFESRVKYARQKAVEAITERLSLELAAPQISAKLLTLTGRNGENLFPLPFGISRVADSGDAYINRIEAIMQSERMITFSELGLVRGQTRFYEDHMSEVIAEERALREELGEKGFFDEEERAGEAFGVLRPVFLKLLRKGTAWQDLSAPEKVLIDSDENFQKLQRYYSLLKTVDYIKQWSTNPQIAQYRARRVFVLVNLLRELVRDKAENFRIFYDPRTEGLLNSAIKLIFSNSKLPEVGSEFAFFMRAPGYRYPGIITMDVVGLGLRNAAEFQILLQSMGRASSDQWESMMRTAADDVTLQFQSAYRKVVDKLQSWGIDDFVTRMGGDEITIICADGYKLTPQRLFQLKEAGNFRVAATRGNADMLPDDSIRQTSVEAMLMPDFLFETMRLRHPLIHGLLRLDDLIAALKEDEHAGRDTVRMILENGEAMLYSRAADGSLTETKDSAAAAEGSSYGGIDLDSSDIPLERSGKTLSWDWAMIPEVMNINSLVPVITGIAPVESFGGWMRS